MKILQLTHKSPIPEHDGASRAMISWATSWLNSGNDVFIFCISTKKHHFSFNLIPDSLSKIRFVAVECDNKYSPKALIKNFFFSRIPVSVSACFFNNAREQLINLLKSNDFDVVIFEGLFMWQYLPTVKNFSNAKIIFRPHNVENEIYYQRYQIEKNPFKKTYLFLLAKRTFNYEVNVINKYDKITPICEEDNSFFSYHGNIKPSLTLLPGLAVPDCSRSDSLPLRNILFFGSLDWQPNIEAVKFLIREVLPLTVDFKLVVAGRNASSTLAEYLKKHNNVIFLGEISSPDLIYCRGEIVVTPIFNGGGVKIKILEALSYRKVVVACSHAVRGLSLINGKHFLQAQTAQQFVDAIMHLNNSIDDFLFIKNAAFDYFCENFSLKRSSDKALSFMKL